MCASVLNWYCLSFVEKTVILFNTHDFVIPTWKRPIDDSQGWVNIFDDALETTVGVKDKNRNHAKQQNNIPHENFRDMFHMCLRSNHGDNKLR